jgi:FixJ family two-component response regulator
MHTIAGVVAVVEDDPGMRKSIERLLRASGYGTAVFASAEEFIQRGSEDAIALVLDIHLPGMTGIELRRTMLASGSLLPVIFVTAFDDATLRVEALATGCIDYLYKPFESHRLIEALERCRKAQR